MHISKSSIVASNVWILPLWEISVSIFLPFALVRIFTPDVVMLSGVSDLAIAFALSGSSTSIVIFALNLALLQDLVNRRIDVGEELDGLFEGNLRACGNIVSAAHALVP